MKRQITGLTLIALLFALCVPAKAQQAGKVYRIGYLSLRNGIESREEALLKSLRNLGYIEGQNIIIEWRFAKGKGDLLPEFAADLVRQKVDCIISTGTESTRAAKQATGTIPLIIANVGNPVEVGFVASLPRPGGNITGFSMQSAEVSGKRLELLKEAFPKISRVGVLGDPTNAGTLGNMREIENAAPALGLKLQSLEVRPPYDFESAFQAARKGRAEAIIANNAGLNPYRPRIVNLEVKTRLPVMHSDPLFALAGGLMSYSTDISEQFRRVAIYVDKILKGTKPADLPIEQPTKFEFIINLKTAKQIGVTIPQWLLMRADRVMK
jgi:putative tryptophan/tyrosine transport system substrate-binding protein